MSVVKSAPAERADDPRVPPQPPQRPADRRADRRLRRRHERHAALRGCHQDDGRQQRMSVAPAPAVEQRVLIHAPRGRDAQVVSQVLHAQAMHPEVCDSLELLNLALQAGAGIAFVTEESLGGPALEPLTDWVAHQPPWSDFPFIVLVARRVGRRPSAASGALVKLGNVVLLERPLNTDTLVSAARWCCAAGSASTRPAATSSSRRRRASPSGSPTPRRAAPTRRSRSRSTPANSARSTARGRCARSNGTRSARSTSGWRPMPRSTSIASIRSSTTTIARACARRSTLRSAGAVSTTSSTGRSPATAGSAGTPCQGAHLSRGVGRADPLRRRHARHQPPEAARGRARGAARSRAPCPWRGRAGGPGEGRVPGDPVARAAHAAQRHPRLDPRARAAPAPASPCKAAEAIERNARAQAR